MSRKIFPHRAEAGEIGGIQPPIAGDSIRMQVVQLRERLIADQREAQDMCWFLLPGFSREREGNVPAIP